MEQLELQTFKIHLRRNNIDYTLYIQDTLQMYAERQIDSLIANTDIEFTNISKCIEK